MSKEQKVKAAEVEKPDPIDTEQQMRAGGFQPAEELDVLKADQFGIKSEADPYDHQHKSSDRRHQPDRSPGRLGHRR